MMRRVWTGFFVTAVATVAGLALTLPAVGQEPDPTRPGQAPLELRGRVVKVGTDQIVLEGGDRKQTTLAVNPKTRFLMNNKPVVISDLRVGSSVATTYVMDGTRYIAGTVTLTEAKSDKEPAPRAATELSGKVVKVAADEVIIETPEKKKVSVMLTSKTRFSRNDKDVLVADIRVGSNVTAVYTLDGTRYVADSVVLVDNLPVSPPPPNKPDTDPPAVKPPAATPTRIEGEVVRVVGEDQVVVRTVDGREVTVFVGPQTSYVFDSKAGTFAALKVGEPIAVEYTVVGTRYRASRITGVTLLEGQVVRVIGKDQVVLKTATGGEQTVYVSPETRYMLTPQGGAFADLRTGTSVNVYYDVRDRRSYARNIFVRPRR